MSDLINRTDAIKAVISADPKDREYHYYKHFAVKALEETPSAEFSKDDLVLRKQVKELVNDMFYHVSKEGLLAEIKALPSAEAVSREDYHNLLMATNDIDRALREYQAKEENEANQNNGRLINAEAKSKTEVARGEWIRKVKEFGHYMLFWHECDQCGSRPPINQFTEQEWLSKFCPCCGAKMKGK